jgi:hypothetical protein
MKAPMASPADNALKHLARLCILAGCLGAGCVDFGPNRFVLSASASAPDEVKAYQTFVISFTGSGPHNCWRLDRIEPYATDSTYDVKFIAVEDHTDKHCESGDSYLVSMQFSEQIYLVKPGTFVIRVAQPDGSTKRKDILVLPGLPGGLESR